MNSYRLNIILGMLLLISLVYSVHQTFTVRRLQTVAEYTLSRGILDNNADQTGSDVVYAPGSPMTRNHKRERERTNSADSEPVAEGQTDAPSGSTQNITRTVKKQDGDTRSPFSVSITQDGKIRTSSAASPSGDKAGPRAKGRSSGETTEQDKDRNDSKVPDPAKSRVLLSQAQEMMRQGHYDNAEGLLLESLEEDKNNRMAWQQMALLQHKQGLTEAEINTYMDWLAESPGDTTPYYQLAATYARMGQDAEARYYLQEYEALSGKKVQTYSQAAAVYRQLQDRPEEGRVLQQWLAETPNSVDAQQAWADYHRRLGDYTTALNQYQDLTRVMPNNPRIYQQMGDLYRRMGDYSQAQYHYESALSLRPTDTGVLNRLGNLYYQNGDTPGALGAYQEIIALEPGSSIVRNAESRIIAIEEQLQRSEAYGSN